MRTWAEKERGVVETAARGRREQQDAEREKREEQA
jgi:hypothetical protein